MKKQFTYIGKDGYRTFKTYKAMQEWAKDESHSGTYYISCPNITFKKTRLQVLENKRKDLTT